jgi:hypothetical protein
MIKGEMFVCFNPYRSKPKNMSIKCREINHKREERGKREKREEEGERGRGKGRMLTRERIKTDLPSHQCNLSGMRGTPRRSGLKRAFDNIPSITWPDLSEGGEGEWERE